MRRAKDNLKAAVFLDRDGTIIHDRGYLRSADEVEFFDCAIPALLRLQQYFRLFIVTNQGGVAKGLLSEEQVKTVNDFVAARLRDHGVDILKTYTCIHQRGDRCSCIKPEPFFACLAAAEFGLRLDRCYTIGDHPHDVDFAVRFGGKGFYVLSGHGKKHRNELSAGVPVCRDLAEAANRIIRTHFPEGES